MPIADVADRYTILLLKKSNGLEVDEDMGAYEKELEGVDYSELTMHNGMLWQVEDVLSTNLPLEMVGKLCLRLRALSTLRVEAKNKIAQKHGGPIERKTY